MILIHRQFDTDALLLRCFNSFHFSHSFLFLRALLLVYSWTKSFSVDFDGEKCHKFSRSHLILSIHFPYPYSTFKFLLLHIFYSQKEKKKKKLEVVKNFFSFFPIRSLYCAKSGSQGCNFLLLCVCLPYIYAIIDSSTAVNLLYSKNFEQL